MELALKSTRYFSFYFWVLIFQVILWLNSFYVLVLFLFFSETQDKEKSIFVASEAVFYDFVTGLAGYRAVITGGSRS